MEIMTHDFCFLSFPGHYTDGIPPELEVPEWLESIILHNWSSFRNQSKKKGQTHSEEESSSTNTMHQSTPHWLSWQQFMIVDSNLSPIHLIIQTSAMFTVPVIGCVSWHFKSVCRLVSRNWQWVWCHTIVLDEWPVIFTNMFFIIIFVIFLLIPYINHSSVHKPTSASGLVVMHACMDRASSQYGKFPPTIKQENELNLLGLPQKKYLVDLF